MKRSWIGLGMLLTLLVLGFLVTFAMARIHEPICRALTAAGEAALMNDWEQAETLYRQAEHRWNRHETFRACFADHGPMEEIDACFASLAVYARVREPVAFAAQCGETAQKARAMGDAHGLKWQNLF